MEINNDTIQKLHDQDIEINLKAEMFAGCHKTEQALNDLQTKWMNIETSKA